MKYNDLNSELTTFIEIIKQNNELMMILDYLDVMKLPNFYIASGSVFQTIWNYYDAQSLTNGIKDIDIVYYDDINVSPEIENKLEEDITNYFASLGVNYEFDIHNEARMHLWKKENENKDIDKYICSEDAIDRWIATVQAIGITKCGSEIKVYAPYGLKDIFCKTIRPIKHSGNSLELYQKKVDSWSSRFDGLNVIEW